LEQVENVVTRARVILNSVGPYWTWGTPVVHACARHGVHYVDLTGETPWVQDIIFEYDYLAEKTGAIIVPSCGFDSLPSDIIALLSYKKLQETFGPGVQLSQSTTSARVVGSMSGGTMKTALLLQSEIPKEKMKLAMQPFSLSPVRGITPFPFKLLYTLPVLKPTTYGCFFFLAPHNLAIVQRSWGLHRVSKNPQLDYGPNFTYNEFMGTKNVVSALLSSVALATWQFLFSLPPLIWLLKLIAPASGTGASDEKLEKGWMHLVNVTSTDPKSDVPLAHVKTVIEGRGDPGYLLTSIMISECALALLDPTKLTDTARKGGILTPAVAFGETIVTRLRATDRFKFESDIIEKGGESKKTR